MSFTVILIVDSPTPYNRTKVCCTCRLGKVGCVVLYVLLSPSFLFLAEYLLEFSCEKQLNFIEMNIKNNNWGRLNHKVVQGSAVAQW